MYLGMTEDGGTKFGYSQIFTNTDKEKTYMVDAVFIHPLFGTGDVSDLSIRISSSRSD